MTLKVELEEEQGVEHGKVEVEEVEVAKLAGCKEPKGSVVVSGRGK